MCKLCGGECCQKMAGSYIPKDFNEPITVEFIISLLDTGKYAIDWWEGDAKGNDLEQTYYLRARHKNENAICGSWGGVCVNWTNEKGCVLNENERPYQCRKLIPNYINGKTNCYFLIKDKSDKKYCAIAWYSYQIILNTAICKYQSSLIEKKQIKEPQIIES